MDKISKRFEFTELPLPGLYLIQRKPLEDERGFFCRFFCEEEFKRIELVKSILQINHTYTQKKGTVRGLHFQHPPFAETKIVSCLRGEIFDVAVDIRKNSPTFLKWYGVLLSSESQKSLLIPEGFAHGFQALTEDTEILYLVTERYSPENEDALNAQDPILGIQWPLTITELSAKDKAIATIDQDFNGI